MNRITPALALALVAACTCLAAAPARQDSIDVTGLVKNPGKYSRVEGATLLSAIDAAGGEEANKDLKVVVIRKINDKLTQEISFSSLKALREHVDADVPVLKNDRIVVASATAK